ncbi:MAG: hypothetical protein UHI85_02815, partial [Turicibacter sp.]|nr:hypothetical protein [Turicibacter sp.]
MMTAIMETAVVKPMCHLRILIKVLVGIVVSIITEITTALVSIWGFVEGILIICDAVITTDADGNPLQ